jgi:hypothetical protein
LEDQEGFYCYQRIESALEGKSPQAIVIRTLPNDTDKLSRKYSHTDPPFWLNGLLCFFAKGNPTLVIDLPSVDKERTKENS